MKQIELCDSIIISAKTIIADAEELKAKENKIRADERAKAINEFMKFVKMELPYWINDCEEIIARIEEMADFFKTEDMAEYFKSADMAKKQRNINQ